MELLRRVQEDEVAETYVRAELASERFRGQILAGTRGWRIGGLFDGFPDELEWHRAALAPHEVLDILYIAWEWWLTISGGTRSPRDAARRIHARDVAGADAERHRPIAARLRSAVPPPELIAVKSPDGPLVLVEGHVRLTAYALFPEFLPRRLEIYVGVAEAVAGWPEYSQASRPRRQTAP
jgi:hypothetical protein